MPLLDGRRLLVTGVLTDRSIAYAVAEGAQREGAEVVLTGFGRSLRLTSGSPAASPAPPTCSSSTSTTRGSSRRSPQRSGGAGAPSTASYPRSPTPRPTRSAAPSPPPPPRRPSAPSARPPSASRRSPPR